MKNKKILVLGSSTSLGSAQMNLVAEKTVSAPVEKITFEAHPGLIDLTLQELDLLEKKKKRVRINLREPNFIEKHRMNKKPKKTKKRIIAWSGSKFIR